VDESAHRLLRSYHHIVLDVTGQTPSLTFPECAGGGGASLCTGDGGKLIMGIYNVDLFLQVRAAFPGVIFSSACSNKARGFHV